jgi:DNA-binding MarR family transcriptional regulator
MRALTIYLVKQTEAAIRAHLDLVLRRHNLATAQYTALTVLRNREGLSSAQLARRSFVKPQTMHEMVVGLERQGLIERRPSADRRHVLLIQLTEQGQRRLADAQADVDRIERQMVRDLAAEEVATLRDLLERCHLGLSDPLPAAPGQ